MYVTYISTEEAKKSNLPGSDVFKYSALAYYSDLDRKRYIVDLKTIAYECLKSVCERLKKHPPNQPLSHAEMYLNFLEIGTSFEIYLKAVLLEKGFLIHKFGSTSGQNKNDNTQNKLLELQKKQPIKFQVAINTFGFRYDDSDSTSQKNVLGGVSHKSLEFNTILSETKYVEHLGLTAQELKLANLFRKFRNHIHCPGDFEYISCPQDAVYTWEWLFNFVNEKIVETTNKCIIDNDLHPSLSLEKLYPPLEIKGNIFIPMTGYSS